MRKTVRDCSWTGELKSAHDAPITHYDTKEDAEAGLKALGDAWWSGASYFTSDAYPMAAALMNVAPYPLSGPPDYWYGYWSLYRRRANQVADCGMGLWPAKVCDVRWYTFTTTLYNANPGRGALPTLDTWPTDENGDPYPGSIFGQDDAYNLANSRWRNWLTDAGLTPGAGNLTSSAMMGPDEEPDWPELIHLYEGDVGYTGQLSYTVGNQVAVFDYAREGGFTNY
jgi:hypothetical protein